MLSFCKERLHLVHGDVLLLNGYKYDMTSGAQAGFTARVLGQWTPPAASPC